MGEPGSPARPAICAALVLVAVVAGPARGGEVGAVSGREAPRGLLIERDGELVPATFAPEEEQRLLPVRARNYWAIKAPRHPYWNGQISIDERGHAYFADPAYSARAFFRLMRTYRYRYGLTTIAEIVHRFVPPTDTIGSLPDTEANPTARYTRWIAGRVGVAADAELLLFDESGRLVPERAVPLAQAFAAWELGSGLVVSEALIREGITLAESE